MTNENSSTDSSLPIRVMGDLEEWPDPPQKPDESVPLITNAAGKRICGAKKSSGGICQSTMIYHNGRCKMHGGPSLRGPAHPAFKHGKYSRAMPTNLAKAYKRAENDPELLSLRSDVAVLQALSENALETMSGEFPPWEEVATIVEEIGPLQVGKPLSAETLDTINQLRSLITKGTDAAKAWEKGKRELKDCIERKTYTSTAEHKRLHDQSLSLSVEQAMTFVSAYIEAARAVVKPRNEVIYRELMVEIAKLLPGKPRGWDRSRVRPGEVVLDLTDPNTEPLTDEQAE